MRAWPARRRPWAAKSWYVLLKYFYFQEITLMPLITFANSEHAIKTVYAAAGSHTETILKIAKDNQIPIAFE